MMKGIVKSSIFLIGFLNLIFTISVSADEEDTKVRSEIAKPLQAAQQMIKESQFAEALNALKDAENVTNRTNYEDYVLNQLRIVAALKSSQLTVATQSFETIDHNPMFKIEQRNQFSLAIANSFYNAKDYVNAKLWSDRYLSQGGRDVNGYLIKIQSDYLSDRFEEALIAAQEYVLSEKKINHIPPENILKIWASSAKKLKKNDDYLQVLFLLCDYYTSSDYWKETIYQISIKPGADKLILDIDRFRNAVNIMGHADDYMEYADLAINQGFAGEAKKIIEKGYSVGLLGQGKESSRHNKLKMTAQKNAESDLRTLATVSEESLKAKTGDPLITNGFDYYGYDQSEKAIALMEKGLEKGGLKNPNESKLHLAIVYWSVGQFDKAQDYLQTISGHDVMDDIARLWSILVSKK